MAGNDYYDVHCEIFRRKCHCWSMPEYQHAYWLPGFTRFGWWRYFPSNQHRYFRHYSFQRKCLWVLFVALGWWLVVLGPLPVEASLRPATGDGAFISISRLEDTAWIVNFNRLGWFHFREPQLAQQSGNALLQSILSGNAPSSVNVVKQLPPELRDQARECYSKALQTIFYVFIALADARFLLGSSLRISSR